ncbi:MAG TPA: hypothetical protein VLE23_14650 [Geminicoccaceae bacterium]|nr:hypothetical protein [Geminicoccaceae bacterium]
MFKRISRGPARSIWPTLGHLILAAGTAIALISAPITFKPDSLAVTWQAAHGKSDGSHTMAEG